MTTKAQAEAADKVAKAARQRLSTALLSLPAKQLAVVRARYFAKDAPVGYGKLAERLRIGNKTARRLDLDAMKALREALS